MKGFLEAWCLGFSWKFSGFWFFWLLFLSACHLADVGAYEEVVSGSVSRCCGPGAFVILFGSVGGLCAVCGWFKGVAMLGPVTEVREDFWSRFCWCCLRHLSMSQEVWLSATGRSVRVLVVGFFFVCEVSSGCSWKFGEKAIMRVFCGCVCVLLSL